VVSRDLAREARFLADAARRHDLFVAQAQARLEVGEEVYSNSWAWIGLRRLLAELLEEAADLGAWSVLADQALDREQLTEQERQRIRALLELAARRGAQAHAALTAGLDSLRALEKGAA